MNWKFHPALVSREQGFKLGMQLNTLPNSSINQQGFLASHLQVFLRDYDVP